jgi:hypothetical protein
MLGLGASWLPAWLPAWHVSTQMDHVTAGAAVCTGSKVWQVGLLALQQMFATDFGAALLAWCCPAGLVLFAVFAVNSSTCLQHWAALLTSRAGPEAQRRRGALT